MNEINEITITLTKSQVENLTEFFDLGFIRFIHERIEDEEDGLDNMAYLVDMCEIYSKLKLAEMALKYIGSSDVEGSSVEVEPAPTAKMTNFDRVMAMSLRELAEFINHSNSGCNYCVNKDCCDCSDVNCNEKIREWLEEEIE